MKKIQILLIIILLMSLPLIGVAAQDNSTLPANQQTAALTFEQWTAVFKAANLEAKTFLGEKGETVTVTWSQKSDTLTVVGSGGGGNENNPPTYTFLYTDWWDLMVQLHDDYAGTPEATLEAGTTINLSDHPEGIQLVEGMLIQATTCKGVVTTFSVHFVAFNPSASDLTRFGAKTYFVWTLSDTSSATWYALGATISGKPPFTYENHALAADQIPTSTVKPIVCKT